MERERIQFLDGFRAIAIIAVMLFHFFNRWTLPLNRTNLYPYTTEYTFFGYGYLGVQFFFMISGFVIFYTLDHTQSLKQFWIKRFIRLFPAMLIASLITFTIFNLFDKNILFKQSHPVLNFLPSLTFITPLFFETLFKPWHIEIDYLSGSYWSLWPEVQFYFLSSSLYFINKEKFFKRFMIVTLVIILFNWFIGDYSQQFIALKDFEPFYNLWFVDIFNLPRYLIFFVIGVLLYKLFKKDPMRIRSSVVLAWLAIITTFMFLMANDENVRIAYSIMLCLFLLGTYWPKLLMPFENKWLVQIGLASYFIYLIHENISILIINSYGRYFKPYGFVLPVILMVLICLLSILFTIYIDKNIASFLKKRMLPKK